MKRVLKYLALAFLLVILSLVGAVVSAFWGMAPIQGGQRLDGVQVVKDGIVSCYLVDLGPREVALVDACNSASGQPILDALGKRGLGPEAVKAILLTHGDRDHISGALAFPKAQVMALAPDVALAEGREARMFKWLRPPKDTGIRVTRTLSDGETFDLSGVHIQAFSVPGHTKGSVAFLARGVLFLGDSAEVTSALELAPAKKLSSDDPAQNRASLHKLAQRLAPMSGDIKAIAPAHSGVLAKGIEAFQNLPK
jgi:glyoxylase-like metal-dependent hydrolase (beta-lactamase superfamily II)